MGVCVDGEYFKEKTMSLIIRKECQPLLDNLGLEDLHVELYSKVLNICLEDGTPIIVLNGIKVNNTRPTKVEIAYVVELFSNFLETKNGKLKEYHLAYCEFTSTEKPSTQGKYFNKNKYGSAYTYTIDDITSAVFNPENNKLQVNCSLEAFSNVSKIVTKAMKELDTILLELNSYKEKQENLKSLKSKVLS